MAEVDTSIYKSPPPINPLLMAGQVVGIQNAQQQNRLLQQQQDLRSATGEAAMASTDPATGAFDFGKYQGMTGSDPRSAWNQPDIIAQSATNQSAQANAQQDQLKNAQAHLVAGNQALTGLLGNPGLGKTDLTKEAKASFFDLTSNPQFGITPDQANKMFQTWPSDPAAQKVWIQNKANQNSAFQNQIGDIYKRTFGADITADTGPAIVGGKQNIETGALSIPPQPGIVKATGPETRAGFVEIYQQQPDGTYQKVMVPRGTLPGASGVFPGSGAAPAPLVPPNPLVAQAGNNAAKAKRDAANQPTPAQTQAVTGATATEDATIGPRGGAPAVPAPTAAAAGPVLAAPPPGVTESQQADVTRYKADQANIPTRQTNVQSLQKAKTALDALSLEWGGSGKGTDTLNHWKSVINSITGGFSGDAMNFDEAKKYLTDYARNQGAAAHSDLQLQAAQGSNASTEISNKAALDVVKTNIGRERQAIAQTQEHTNPTGIGYGKHASDFATATDPRGFAADTYTAGERAQIVDKLKGNDLKKYLDSVAMAKRLGFF